MEAEELKYLLNYLQSQLERAKTNKERLSLLRDRALISIMNLEGCRTVEMHQLKVADILRQGIKTGLQVAAKRASRIVSLTENLAAQLNLIIKVVDPKLVKITQHGVAWTIGNDSSPVIKSLTVMFA